MESKLPYAHLTEKQLDKIKQVEEFINTQPDRDTPGPNSEVILLAIAKE